MRYYTLFGIIVLISCCEKNKKIDFDSNLSSNFFTSNYIFSVFENRKEYGIAELSIRMHNGARSIKKEGYINPIYANKIRDSLILSFNYVNSYNRIIILDSLFSIESNYITDIRDTYPTGKFDGTTISPR